MVPLGPHLFDVIPTFMLIRASRIEIVVAESTGRNSKTVASPLKTTTPPSSEIRPCGDDDEQKEALLEHEDDRTTQHEQGEHEENTAL
jgi:hypothetical protein